MILADIVLFANGDIGVFSFLSFVFIKKKTIFDQARNYDEKFRCVLV